MIPTSTAAAIAGALAHNAAALPQSTGAGHVARQLWGLDFPEPTSTTASSHCTPFTLPSSGIIFIANSALTLTTDATFQPQCTGNDSGEIFSVDHLRDPFYASTIPQTYVIAASTVIAWILVTMLVITPRTAFLGAPNASSSLLHSRGIIGGASGGMSLTGAGSRPWLQKLATLTAAISLTIATADTFTAAKWQYRIGFMDAQALRDEVLGSLEIRIVRVISDIFLWLAQVQTLIRLFPRHKEKVLIKWIGFALIVLDTIFSCLNSFAISATTRSPHFEDAIPALSYLFELALGLLYAAWVIYYSLTKRRYAFFHSKMRNICIIAVLSIVAVSTPVVFFVTDVSNPEVAGWGDYVRWVGAGAASVVVWEWVERIEALERDEKKDGILGREIFDGDEMLDLAPTEEAVWSRSRNRGNLLRRHWGDNDRGGAGGFNKSSTLEQGRAKHSGGRFRARRNSAKSLGRENRATSPSVTSLGRGVGNGNTNVRFGNLPTLGTQHNRNALSPPPHDSQTPVSRADTTSAASTVYVVRYQSAMDVPQPVRRDVDANGNTKQSQAKADAQAWDTGRDPEKEAADDEPNRDRRTDQFWQTVSNPFKRKRSSPPKEVQQARAAAQASSQTVPPKHNYSKWDIKNRLGVLAAETGDRFRDRAAGRRPHPDLPVTVIPAQPRGSGQMWSPNNLTSQNGNDGQATSTSEPLATTSTATNTNDAATSHVPGSSDGSTTLVNSRLAASPARFDLGIPATPQFRQAAATHPDNMFPSTTLGHGSSDNGGIIVIPAPELRSRPGSGSPIAAAQVGGNRLMDGTTDSNDTPSAQQ